MSEGKCFISNKKLSLTDKATFDYVFNQYYKPLVLFASSLLNNNKEISEDFVQDIFFNLIKKNNEFDSLNSLKSYLFTSVRNSCYDHNKHLKIRHQYAVENRVTALKEVFFLNRVLEEEIYSHLIKSVSLLPEKCRNVFELGLAGTKNSEIASKLKISIETVKSHKKRGNKLLYKMLRPIMHFF